MNRVTINPDQCGGKPCIRGMRVREKDVLDMLAEGTSPEEILTDFPDLEPQDIQACVAYAAGGRGLPSTVEYLVIVPWAPGARTTSPSWTLRRTRHRWRAMDRIEAHAQCSDADGPGATELSEGMIELARRRVR